MALSMQDKFGVRSLHGRSKEMTAALYLQVSIVSQALIFVTRSRSWSYVERPGLLLVSAFVIAQLVNFMKSKSSCLLSFDQPYLPNLKLHNRYTRMPGFATPFAND